MLGAGEALCFGLDSIEIPFIAEAGGVLFFYAIGISIFYYLAIRHMADTNYDKSEEGAVIPNHILEEKGIIADDQATHGNDGVLSSKTTQSQIV